MTHERLQSGELKELGRDFASKCRDRMLSLDLKGKKRDSACIDYYSGGVAALDLLKHDQMKNLIGEQMARIVAYRGYEGVLLLCDGI